MSLTSIEAGYQRAVEPSWTSPVDDLGLARWTDQSVSMFDASQVVDEARGLVESHPESSAMHARLAQAELAEGSRERALLAAKEALDLAGPSDGAAVAAALRVVRALGEWDEVDPSLFDREVGHSPTSALFAAHTGNLDVANRWLGDHDDGSSHAVRGWLEMRRGNTRNALRLLRRASHSSAPQPSSLINLGYLYALTGSWKKAIRVTAEALSLDPRNKTAALNLAGFLATTGNVPKAERILKDFGTHGFDVEIETNRIQLRFQASQDAYTADSSLAALSRIVRVRGGDQTELLSIEALRSLIKHETGQASSDETAERLRQLLETYNYASVEMAVAYAGFLNDSTDADQIDDLLEKLGRYGRTEEELVGLRARRELLRFNFEAAIRLAQSWEQREPFNFVPTSLVTYLECVFRADFDQAVSYGLTGIERQPRNDMLANNVAYALASLGRVGAARRVLPETSQNPVFMATFGWIVLNEGNQAEGAEWYRKAIDLAHKLKRPELADAIGIRLSISLLTLGVESERKSVARFYETLPSNVDLKLLQFEAERVLAR